MFYCNVDAYNSILRILVEAVYYREVKIENIANLMCLPLAQYCNFTFSIIFPIHSHKVKIPNKFLIRCY